MRSFKDMIRINGKQAIRDQEHLPGINDTFHLLSNEYPQNHQNVKKDERKCQASDNDFFMLP